MLSNADIAKKLLEILTLMEMAGESFYKYTAYERALTGIDHRICYAVKANSNLAVLQILARLGAGFDIVSAGELYRVDCRKRILLPRFAGGKRVSHNRLF